MPALAVLSLAGQPLVVIFSVIKLYTRMLKKLRRRKRKGRERGVSRRRENGGARGESRARGVLTPARGASRPPADAVARACTT